MGQNSERIELPDGNWWEIRTVVTRQMRKQFRRAFQQGLAKLGGLSSIEPGAIRQAIAASPHLIDLDAIEDAYLLYGTEAYSYGGTVDLATIDTVPETAVASVLSRMRELYAEMSEETRKGFFEPSP
jgi:hypothetical protein